MVGVRVDVFLTTVGVPAIAVRPPSLTYDPGLALLALGDAVRCAAWALQYAFTAVARIAPHVGLARFASLASHEPSSAAMCICNMGRRHKFHGSDKPSGQAS